MREIKKPNIVLIDIEKVSPYEHNAKVHPEAQVKKIATSIKKYGFDQPIVCDRDMVIIKGHGRFAASQLLGLKRVPVLVRDDLTIDEANAARIADNKAIEGSRWDLAKFKISLDEIKGIELHEITLEALPEIKVDEIKPPQFEAPREKPTTSRESHHWQDLGKGGAMMTPLFFEIPASDYELWLKAEQKTGKEAGVALLEIIRCYLGE